MQFKKKRLTPESDPSSFKKPTLTPAVLKKQTPTPAENMRLLRLHNPGHFSKHMATSLVRMV